MSAPTPARARSSLAVRVTLLVIAVAVLVAVIASVAGILVVRRTLVDDATAALADRADVISAQLPADPAAASGALAAMGRVLEAQGVTVIDIAADGSFSPTTRPAQQAAKRAGAHQAVGGRSISGSANVGGTLLLVQARSTATGGFALVAPADVAAATRQALERRLLWAIGGGVLAAILVGLLVARLVSAPLRRTAALARAMGGGARDLRAPVTGPREVAEVSTAVNELADALTHSESRQRQFLASVSHELRTPLAGISGQAQALADGLVPAAEHAQLGTSITAEAARLERMVSDLLDLARAGADDFRLDLAATDLTALMVGMAGVWRPRCDARGVPLLLDVPPGAVTVTTDARRIRQVLDGLAENALRVLTPGRPMLLHLGVTATAAVLQVRDGGPGLAAEDYPVAFEQGVLHERYRNRRGPGGQGGAGLGLALAHSLVQRLGGTIDAGPAPEGGVAVTIVLPMTQAVPGPVVPVVAVPPRDPLRPGDPLTPAHPLPPADRVPPVAR